MTDILLIKMGKSMTPKQLETFRADILAQMESNLIVLPAYCEYSLIPRSSTTTTILQENGFLSRPYDGGFISV